MKKLGLEIVLFCVILVFFCQTAIASTLRKEQIQTYMFAVPEGGWSSCRVQIIYTEKYTYSNLNERNTFTERGKYFTGTYAYATACPILRTGAAVIKRDNGNTFKTFSSWTSVSRIFPGGIDTMGYYENYGTYTLSLATRYTGQVNYTVSCSGATPGSYIKNISMSLATE